MARRTAPQRKTLLIVGEGDTEVAFLKYLRSVYGCGARTPKTTVKNAHGKGPCNVLEQAIRQQRAAAYDKVVAVLDTDIPWTDELNARAHEHDIELIGNRPCIEGMFLTLLGKPVPAQSAACKTKLHKLIGVNLLDARAYASWCTPERLEDAVRKTSSVARLQVCLRGN